jgi:hypothetical protein
MSSANLERGSKSTSAAKIPSAKARLLEGKRGLIVGIANDQSIAWGCARAFRALGAEIAVTYFNDKARKYVEPLARELQAPIFMPLDVGVSGQMEAVFERIGTDWGRLDFLVHSIAFSPKEALQGRVVDVSRDGFLTTMDVSCWTFIPHGAPRGTADAQRRHSPRHILDCGEFVIDSVLKHDLVDHILLGYACLSTSGVRTNPGQSTHAVFGPLLCRRPTLPRANDNAGAKHHRTTEPGIQSGRTATSTAALCTHRDRIESSVVP